LENEEALKGYAVHPAHVEVADTKVRPFTASRSCIDFNC
ncbi:MAG: Dabb family protein, partial [Clostridia bacterium]|nr:Dabb family protein [Clostridia bacterium]